MTTNDQPINERLTPKQELFLSLLLSGISLPAATKQAGIGEKTGRRWLKLPHVQKAYQELQQELFNERLMELKTGVNVAISTLRRHMTSDETKPYTQVHAAERDGEQG